MNDLVIALALGLGIGVGCRGFDLPLPAPPKLVGALLVLAMTLGFLGADRLLRGVTVSAPGRSLALIPEPAARRGVQ